MHWPSNACPHAHACTLHRMAAAVLVVGLCQLSDAHPGAWRLAASLCSSQAAALATPAPCFTPSTSMCYAALPHLWKGRHMQHSSAPDWYDSSCL